MSMTGPANPPRLVHLVAQHAAVVPGHVTLNEIPSFLADAFGAVAEDVARSGGAITGPPFARFLLGPTGFEVVAGFPVDAPLKHARRSVSRVLPGGPALRALHVGEYSKVGDAYAAAQVWMADRDYRATGEPWECYLDEPGTARPRTVVFVPCTTGPSSQDPTLVPGQETSSV